jgi:hypothetical protein
MRCRPLASPLATKNLPHMYLLILMKNSIIRWFPLLLLGSNPFRRALLLDAQLRTRVDKQSGVSGYSQSSANATSRGHSLQWTHAGHNNLTRDRGHSHGGGRGAPSSSSHGWYNNDNNRHSPVPSTCSGGQSRPQCQVSELEPSSTRCTECISSWYSRGRCLLETTSWVCGSHQTSSLF